MHINHSSFDDAKLASMAPPLTIRIEKFKNNSRIPIPIPASEDGKQGGTDWTHEDVRKVEEWLVTEWAGGGTYEISVTDSSVPNPLVMKWRPHWPPGEYPERTPPPLAEAHARANQTQIQPQVRQMAAFPNGLPIGGGFPAPMSSFPQQQAYAPFFPPQYAQMPAAPPIGTPQWQQYQAEADRRRLDDELRVLREQAAHREREALQAKHSAELKAAEQANERKFETKFSQQDSKIDQLMTTINQLTSAIQVSANTPKTNPEIEALREQTRRMEAERDNERREREGERRERETREQMRQMQENTQRQFDAMQRQFEVTAAKLSEAAANKSDPLFMMMQEQSRQQSDALKEISRNQTAQLERIQGFMMNPRDMIAMAKESRESVDAATDKVANQFGRVFEMQQKATEHILNMQPQGGGALDLVRDGVQGVKEIAERYMGAKATSERLQHQTQAQIAEAQSRAYIASVQPVVVQPQPATALGNPATVTPITAAKPKKVSNKVEATKSEPAGKRLGRSDLEWFGGALITEVEQLREGVAIFVESCNLVPTRMTAKGEIEGVSPIMAAMGIMQAVGAVAQAQIAVPAMIDLFFQERFADFVDVLLPAAPQNYRDDLTQIVIGHVKHAKSVAGEPDTEIETDELEDDSENVDAAGLA